MSSSTLRAVIFDLGRVLIRVDTSRGLFERLVENEGGHADAVLQSLVKDELFTRYCRGNLTPRGFWQEATQRTGLRLSYEEFARLWCEIFDPMEGMAYLFHRVLARMPVTILSDTDPLHWREACRQFPMLTLLRRPTLSYRIGRTKPDPEAYRRAAGNVGVPPSDCLFIDDLSENVEGARRCGMTALQFSGVEALTAEMIHLGVLPV